MHIFGYSNFSSIQMYNESEQTIQEDSFSHRKNRNETFDAKSVCA